MKIRVGHRKYATEKFPSVFISIPPKPQETRGMTGEVFTVLRKPFQSKWFDIVIRNIRKPNIASSPMHCHGVEMVTLCVKGGYDDRYPDGHERHVRFGRLTHFKAKDFHTAYAVHGKTGAWTVGVDCRWRGLCSAGFLVNGKFMSMTKFVENMGLPDEVVQGVRDLTEGEKARRG